MNGCKEIRLPALAAALERRYPGVLVECWWREWATDGQSGCTCAFKAHGPDSGERLQRYGLAVLKNDKPGTTDLVAVGAPEVTGSGSTYSDGTAYVVHHFYDGDPRVSGGRAYPSKKKVLEFERLWKRISAPKRPQEARP